jgi:hypothetical protein
MSDLEITRGTTNIFADLGYLDAAERQTKTRLASALRLLARLPQTLLAQGSRWQTKPTGKAPPAALATWDKTQHNFGPFFLTVEMLSSSA